MSVAVKKCSDKGGEPWRCGSWSLENEREGAAKRNLYSYYTTPDLRGVDTTEKRQHKQ
jgi:hypothetical protein